MAVVLIIGAVVGYFKYTQDELARLNQEVATKDFALKTTTATLEKTQADLKEQQVVAQKTYDDYQAARNEVNDIQAKFTKNNRDLGAFAAAKPTEVKKRMNDATAKSFRCIEDTVNKGITNAQGC